MLCWADVVFPASAPVPSSSQSKKIYSMQWVLLGEVLVISAACEVWGCRFDFRKDQLLFVVVTFIAGRILQYYKYNYN